MIEVVNLTKRFTLSREQQREMGFGFTGSTVDAVSDLSFTCQPGRVLTLLGPNGAGKTTALRIIAGMLKPTSGTVTIAGHDVVRERRKVLSRLGFLTGSTGLYDRLTPTELLRYHADLHRLDRGTFETRKDQLFRLLGIDEFAGRRVGKLSTGMKQKVSIARTIIHDPQVVVFDEPTSGLDVLAARSIMDLIRTCREDGKTVIFSTHIMGEVSLLSDDLAIIHRGKLLYSGAFADFRNQMHTDSLEDEFVRVLSG